MARHRYAKGHRAIAKMASKRLHQELTRAKVTEYKAPPGYRLVPEPVAGVCPVCGGELAADDARLKHVSN